MNRIKFNGNSLKIEPQNVSLENIDTSVIYRDIAGKLIKSQGVVKKVLNISGITNIDDLTILNTMQSKTADNVISIIGYGINNTYTMNVTFSADYEKFLYQNKLSFRYSARLEEV